MSYTKKTVTTQKPSLIEFKIVVKVCDNCGALVDDEEVHDRWHNSISTVASMCGCRDS